MKRWKWTRIATVIWLVLLSSPWQLRADVCVYKVPKVRLMCGLIVDPSMRPIPAVTVTIGRTGETIETATTNETGQFSFASLPEGTYQISASVPGFQTGQYKVILVHKTAAWRKCLRIRLAVGMPHCDGAIEVIKATSGSQH